MSGVFNPGVFNPGIFNTGGAGAPVGVDLPSVVLFPGEPLRFRSRWDKTAYVWSVMVRDMRAPMDGYRPMRDHYVDAVRLAAR